MASLPIALLVSATDGSYAIRPVEDPRIWGPIDFAWRFGDTVGRQVTTLGAGPLAGSTLPGSNRLVACGWSPAWDMFYPSTIGGAGLPWNRLGVSFMALSGRARQPSILAITRRGEKLEVAMTPIDHEQAWRGYKDEQGLYALMSRVLDEQGHRLASARILCVGPAAAKTRSGAIGSAPIKDGVLTPVDTWAGRGGLGSRLFKQHGVVAILYGASVDNQDHVPLPIEGLFEELFGKSMKLADLEHTTKYRYDPKFKTGGTFGNNYQLQRERVLAFNYQSVMWGERVRERIHERLIASHYLRQFNEEIVEKDKSHHCGEPCAATCKKVDSKFKKDYEPYQSMGPLIGVFDQRAAESITRLADSSGFDAIQVGGEIAWVMECLFKGWLGPEETGIAERPEWDPETMQATVDSAHNAAIGRKVISWILDDPRAAFLRNGLRAAARAVGGPAAQAAVYNANGDAHGCMVPNQYWVPGVLSPVPIMGRYYLDYTYEWQPPRELGRSSARRMVNELMLDNLGMCRFHRGWAESVLPPLMKRLHGDSADAIAHHRQLAIEIQAHNATHPWETERVVDFVHSYLLKYSADGPKEPALAAWLDRFSSDKKVAARAYWQEIRDGLEEELREA
ncbi:MAG: aldehyde ferredoxin oxidoreductase [Deltaproteobacteria bacterium]|nr:aldehyde ferredoxin oxidoreductase [Deltaproteobacteria bacterium]